MTSEGIALLVAGRIGTGATIAERGGLALASGKRLPPESLKQVIVDLL